MSRPVGSTPYLPNAGRARDVTALNAFDQDLNKALFFVLTELARRANESLPKDGSELMTNALGFSNNGVTVITIGGNTAGGALDANGGIEMGRRGVAGTPFIDFHSGATDVDYDARIVSTGGSGVTGGGTLFVDAVTLSLTQGRINFPATQNPSTDAHALDDYEEGDWTPAVTFTTPGNLAVTYINQLGRYIKIGKQVTVWFGFSTATFTHTTAAGTFNITGLPFTSANIVSTFQWSGNVEIGPVTLAAGHTWINSNITNNSAVVRLVTSGGNGVVTRAALGVANFPTGVNFTIYGSITYEAAA